MRSLKKPSDTAASRHEFESTDDAPHFLTFKHPDNLFEIDYPAHWSLEQGDDGAVEFSLPNREEFVGLMIFRTPAQIDSSMIQKAGRWAEIAAAMFAKVDSTNIRHDPTIIYSNFTADRPEQDQGGQRWFVLCSDLILCISSSCALQSKETYHPFFERMLSSLRVYRDDELLAVQILNRVHQGLVAQLPSSKIEIDGLKIVTDKFELSIGNLLVQVKRNPSLLIELVDHFIEGMIGVAKANEALGKESWDSVRVRIQPLLKSDKYIQEVNQITTRNQNSTSAPSAFLVSAPWLADLRICFALDDKDTFRFINSNDMERWGVSLELLLDVAVENLVNLPEPEVFVMRLAPEMPGIGVLQPNGGASSSYLLHPKLFQIAAQQLGRKIVAAVPSRDALMLFEYRNERESLQQAVARDFSTTNHPISDRLFRVTPDGIALL